MTVLTLPPTALANAYRGSRESGPVATYPLTIQQCRECAHSQLREVVDPKLLFTHYKYASGTSASFRGHFTEHAGEIQRWMSHRALSGVVEVGSNDGTLLRALQRRGIRCVGIDPSPELAGTGVDTVEGFFDEATLTQAQSVAGQCNLLVANNVLAHIDDLAGSFKLAAAGGFHTVVFEVQYLQDLFRTGAFDLIYHEHLDYHEATPLVRALPRWGYHIDRIDRVPTHGGSLRIWAVARGVATPSPVLSNVPEIVEFEAANPSSEGWVNLTRKIETTETALHFALTPYKRVALYGAPAKLTTFAAVLLHDSHNIEYVVDDSGWKQGLRTPDGRWPIYSNMALVAENTLPDAVLVTAWNFFPEIEKKLRERGFAGVIICPFPTVQTSKVLRA